METLFGHDRHRNLADSPEEWEKAWTKDLQTFWDGPRSIYGNPSARLVVNTPAALRRSFNSDEYWEEIYTVTHQLLRAQARLGAEAVEKVVLDDFDTQWRSLSAVDRRRTVLEGIHRAMRLPGIHSGRIYCPESTLDYLSSGDGGNYLKLLRFLLPDDTHQPLTEPRFLPHPDVDRYLTIDPACAEEDLPIIKVYTRLIQLDRASCLTHIVSEIFQVHVRHILSLPRSLKLKQCVVSIMFPSGRGPFRGQLAMA